MNSDIINILNLKLSDVQSCTSTKSNNSITYFITLVNKEFFCTHCQSSLKIKGYTKKSIKHNIIFNTQTRIILRHRRYYCPICNTTHYEYNPLCPPSRHISHETVISIMQFLKEPSSTFAMASRLFSVSNSKIVSFFDEFAQQKRLPFSTTICIDEFYWNRRSTSKYACMIMDFSTGNIIDILDGRTLKHWSSYTQLIPKSELQRVRYFCIDMFETYRSVHALYFPKSKLCIDSFHVIKNIHHILNKIRIRTMYQYDKDTQEYYLLKKFNWLLFIDSSKIKYTAGKYNHKLKRYINYPQLLELLLRINPQLKKAYDLKEAYCLFNATATVDTAKSDLIEIMNQFAESEVREFIEYNSTLASWFEEIVNSFEIVYNKRLSNGIIESKNARVKVILKNANGYKNFSRMRNKIMYSLNKDATITINGKKQVIKRSGKKRGSYKSHNPQK